MPGPGDIVGIAEVDIPVGAEIVADLDVLSAILNRSMDGRIIKHGGKFVLKGVKDAKKDDTD